MTRLGATVLTTACFFVPRSHPRCLSVWPLPRPCRSQWYAVVWLPDIATALLMKYQYLNLLSAGMLCSPSDKVFIIFRPRGNLYLTLGILQKWSEDFFSLVHAGKIHLRSTSRWIRREPICFLFFNSPTCFSDKLSLGEAIWFSYNVSHEQKKSAGNRSVVSLYTAMWSEDKGLRCFLPSPSCLKWACFTSGW